MITSVGKRTGKTDIATPWKIGTRPKNHEVQFPCVRWKDLTLQAASEGIGRVLITNGWHGNPSVVETVRQIMAAVTVSK